MPDALTEVNTFDDLTEDFARRLRAGERPTIEEYVRKFPAWAEEIRDVFPAVQMMEDLKPQRSDTEPISFPAPARSPDRIGEFRIIREIGRGGMGVVYEAVQESLGRRVALKVLPAYRLSNETLRTRFHRESHAAAKLHHTNIVPVFAVGEHEGLCYYVMQLISGRGLDRLRKDEGIRKDEATTDATHASSFVVHPSSFSTVLHPRLVAKIGVQVADALAYAHSQGVLHRDVKPSNLLLDDRGQVWVTDFGVAKLVEEANLTQSGDLVGTLRYMPPERFAGQSDARGDVYSLGITLYELLAGKPAFPDTTPHHLIQLITQAEPPRLRKVNPAVPPDLETIVSKAAARDPDRRYASAADLVEDLRAFLDDRPIVAKRIGPIERASRWCRRNPVTAGSLATAFVLMVAVTIVSVVAYVRTAAANRAAADANRDMTEALRAEQAQRETAEATSALALDALNRVYDRFAPTRLVATPPETTAEGVELPAPQPALPPEAIPLLEDSLRTYEKIAQTSRAFARLQSQAAEANHRIGDIHQRLGRSEASIAAYRVATAMYSELLADGSGGDAVRIKLARSCNELARALRSIQKFDDAMKVQTQAIRTLAEAPQPFADRPECRYELARTYYTMGQWDFPNGPGMFSPGPPRPGGPKGFGPPKFELGPKRPFGPGAGAEPRGPHPIHRAVELLEKLVDEHPSVPEYRHLLACCYRDAPPPWGQPPTGGPTDRAIDLLRRLVADHPKVPDYRFDLCETLRRVPPPRPFAGAPDPKNRERLQEAVDSSAELVAQYPNVPQYAAAHAQYLDRLGIELYVARELAEAERTHRKAMIHQSALVKQYPDVASYGLWLSQMERSLARVLADRGDLKEARTRLESAASRLEILRAKDPGLRPLLGITYRELSGVLTRSGETELAAKTTKKADEFGPPFGPPPYGPAGKFGPPPGKAEKGP